MVVQRPDLAQCMSNGLTLRSMKKRLIVKGNICILKREMTDSEFQHMKHGFDEHTIENDVEVQQADRYGFVALENEKFVGCSSGLAYKNGGKYSGWFYLTDLFVEKEYRFREIGKALLSSLEEELKEKGIAKIWTWTAGYEAPAFYIKQGYKVFAEMENWYSDGSGRIGLRKEL